MSYTSSHDPKFRARIAAWIAERQEVVVLIRSSRAAGSKDFEFFTSVDAFNARIQELAPQTCVTVFGSPQLPLRGTVDDDFVRKALTLISDGDEFLILGLRPVKYGSVSWYSSVAGETHSNLLEELLDRLDEPVALGPYPPWIEDADDVISAVVPNQDGSITGGVY